MRCRSSSIAQREIIGAEVAAFFAANPMLFGAVVGAVFAIAESRQLEESSSGTELGSGADNGFLEPPIAPINMVAINERIATAANESAAATPAAARKAARSPLARAAPPLSVPPCSLPPAAGSRASERRV